MLPESMAMLYGLSGGGAWVPRPPSETVHSSMLPTSEYELSLPRIPTTHVHPISAMNNRSAG